jgi:hypothetical protein
VGEENNGIGEFISKEVVVKDDALEVRVVFV